MTYEVAKKSFTPAGTEPSVGAILGSGALAGLSFPPSLKLWEYG